MEEIPEEVETQEEAETQEEVKEALERVVVILEGAGNLRQVGQALEGAILKTAETLEGAGTLEVVVILVVVVVMTVLGNVGEVVKRVLRLVGQMMGKREVAWEVEV